MKSFEQINTFPENLVGNEEELKETYKESELFKLLDAQDFEERKTAFFTDIDNTFYREDRVRAKEELEEKAKERSVPIIAVTGNDLAAVIKKIKTGELPQFPVIVGSVGTEIWVLNNGQYKKDTYFENILKKSGFVREFVVEKAREMISNFRNSNPKLNLDFQKPDKEKELSEKPDPDYQSFKVSFYFFSDSSEILEEVAEKAEKYFSGKHLVIAEEIGYNRDLPLGQPKKYCLDVLPISKSGAVNYLAKISGIEKGIVAGDSGNDVDMLLETGRFNSVLVGGYKPEAESGVGKAVLNPKKGKSSFQRILGPDGNTKAVYIEKKGNLGPESILRAVKILGRAENIKRIRKTSGNSV